MPFARVSGSNNMATSYIGTKASMTTNGTISTSLTFPTIGNSYPYNVANVQQLPITTAARLSKGHLTNSNVAYIEYMNFNGLPNESQQAIEASMSVLGYANNIRS